MSTPKKPRKSAAKEAPAKGRLKIPLSKKEQQDKRWQLFSLEYVKDFNGTRAAREAGYSAKTATAQASRLLTNVKVQKLVKAASEKAFSRAEVDGARVVRYLNDVLTADPRELVEIFVSACRHCYGVANGYQYTLGEYNAKREKWLDEGRPIEKFDEKGGVGYDPRKPPASDCPECFGEGIARTVLKDTRSLSAQAVALYGGVRRNKDGTAVPVLVDQLAAAEKLMRHHGQYLADNKQQGGAGLPGVLEVVFVEPPARTNDPLQDSGHAPA